MTQAVSHINFTRNDLNQAGNVALTKVGNDPRWVKIIYRALEHLAQGKFIYDGHVVTLKSATSELVYRIDVREPMHCTCKGRSKGYTCWHVTAARLIVRAAELNQEASQQAGTWYKGFYYTAESLEASRQVRAGSIDAETQAKADEMFA